VCLSPSLWFDAGRTVDALAAARPPPAARLYLDVGAREGPAMVACAQRAAAAAAHLGDRLRFRLDPRGRHDERAWRRRFPAALRFALAMSP
jgi:predicted alpha/beta superfamily hydrolase